MASQPKIIEKFSITSVPRDSRLDAFRGLLLVLMTINHAPTPLARFGVSYLGYFSGAEGFMFLSGLVAGIVYTRTSIQSGPSAVWHQALHRARTIYFFHIISFVVLFLFLRAFVKGENYWESWLPLFKEHILWVVFTGGTLLRQPKYLDILPMFIIFVLLTPLIIRHLRINRAWIVMVVSVQLWILAQLDARPMTTIQGGFARLKVPVYFGSFDVFGWQLLFFGGLCCGYLYYNDGWSLSRRVKRLLVVISSIVIGLLFLCRHRCVLTEVIASAIVPYTNKAILGPIRVLNFSAVVFLLACGYSRLKPDLFARGMAYLGRHSLQVFAFHLPVVAAMNVFMPQLSDNAARYNTLILFIAVGSLFIPAWIHEQLKNRSRRTAARSSNVSCPL